MNINLHLYVFIHTHTQSDFADKNNDKGFEEITDIIKRYWTLKESNKILMESIQEQENQVDYIRSRFGELKIKKEILTFSLKIGNPNSETF